MTTKDKETAEILRLYAVQDELVRELGHVWGCYRAEQAQTHRMSHALRHFTRQWLLWPPRFIWAGFGLKIGRKGIKKSRLRPWKWYSRHGAEAWYGVIQYIRLGPVIVELGRRDDLNADYDAAIRIFRQLYDGAGDSGRQQAQEILRRANHSASRPA